MTFELLENGKLGTYGARRNELLAGFSVNLLTGLVVYRRDDEEFCIDILEFILKRHDGMIYAWIWEFTLKEVEKLEDPECSENEHLYTFLLWLLTTKVCTDDH